MLFWTVLNGGRISVKALFPFVDVRLYKLVFTICMS
jgi:hypothetical protein